MILAKMLAVIPGIVIPIACKQGTCTAKGDYIRGYGLI